MWEKQIYELLDKLSQINYEELDIDDFLDQRDSDPFDSEWVRVYQALEELKKGKTVEEYARKLQELLELETDFSPYTVKLQEFEGLDLDSRELGFFMFMIEE